MIKMKEINAEGILTRYTTEREKNVVTLKIQTDSLTKEDLSILKDLYIFGKGKLRPKVVLKLIFDGKVHELLGAYKNAY